MISSNDHNDRSRILIKSAKPVNTARAIPVIWVGACLFIFFVFISLPAAASLDTRLDDLKKVRLSADSVSIEDILKEISEKTGIILYSTADLSEKISIEIEDEPFEKCLQLILGDNSHVLVFRKTGDSEFTPIELKVYPKAEEKPAEKSNAVLNRSSDQSGSVPVREGVTNYDRSSIKRDFGDKNALTIQIEAVETTYGEGTRDTGIRIAGIAEGSVFRQIGLETGDVIRDVNGRMVKSSREFVEAIQAVIDEKLPTIRIARYKHDGKQLPVYININ
jgi:hypothetical protein